MNRKKHDCPFDNVQSFLVPASGIDTGCSKQTQKIVDGKSWVNMLDKFVLRDNHLPGRCSGRQGPTEWSLYRSTIQMNQRESSAIIIRSSWWS